MFENITSDRQTTLQEMYLVYEALEQLWKIMSFDNYGTSRLVDFWRFCAVAKTSAGSSVTYSTSVTSSETSVTLSPSEPSITLSPAEPSVTLSPSEPSVSLLSSGKSVATSSVWLAHMLKQPQ